MRLKVNFFQTIQTVLLFLISLNYKNASSYLVFLAFFVCMIASAHCIRVDFNFFLLILISLCYLIFYPPATDTYKTALKQFLFPMCYFIGLNLFHESKNGELVKKKYDNQIIIAILIVSIGSFSHFLINAAFNFSSTYRNTVDYWTGSIISATGQALFAILAISVFATWLFSDGKPWKKWISSLGLLAAFVYNFILAGRTIFILTAIIIVVSFVYTKRFLYLSKHISGFLILTLVCIAVAVAYINNIFGLRDWILNSNFIKRFATMNVMEDSRFALKRVFFSKMFDYPFGGGSLRESANGYAHELFLDAYSDVGIAGYILLVLFVLASGINTIKIAKSKQLLLETRCMVICTFLAINIAFFVEPILQGASWLFYTYCFLSGVVMDICKSLGDAAKSNAIVVPNYYYSDCTKIS